MKSGKILLKKLTGFVVAAGFYEDMCNERI